MRFVPAFLVCAILAGCGDPDAATETIVLPVGKSGGCGAVARTEPAADLSWVRARTPIYRLTREGVLSVGGFDGRPWKLLHSHLPADDWPRLLKSPDGRWIAFETSSDEENRLERWLFDVRTQTERRLETVPVYRASDPEFSPSGGTLAYFTSYDSRATRVGEIGLHFIDAESGVASYAGFPEKSRLEAREGHGSITWSADGRSVLLHWAGHTASGFIREFHRFDVAKKRFLSIDGIYDPQVRGERFIENGRDIAQHLNDNSETLRWFGKLESPSRQIEARIDDQYRLVVRDRAGQERILDSGHYDHCEGVTIGITDWVDDDRYLVYRVSSTQYIADPRTGRRAILFGSSPTNASYAW